MVVVIEAIAHLACDFFISISLQALAPQARNYILFCFLIFYAIYQYIPSI